MEQIAVSVLQPGQVVAQPVTNAQGVVLCPAGFALSEGAIQRLRNAGVEMVYVESAEGGSSARIEDRLAQLQERFRGVHDPLLLRLKAVTENRLRTMISGAPPPTA